MNERWLNLIPSRIRMGDSDLIRASVYDGLLYVVEWGGISDATLWHDSVKSIKMWRFMNDPRQFTGYPKAFVSLSKLALFANEPDLEGYPAWYMGAMQTWRDGGGIVVSPAYSDESKRPAGDPYTLFYGAYSWHCYAGNFRNRDMVLAMASKAGKPVYGTEYARPGEQRRDMVDLGGISEPVALFAWDWAQYANDTRYTLRNVVFDKEQTQMAPPVVLTEATDSNLCGPLSVSEWFDGNGHQVSPYDLYREAHGLDYVAPGDSMSFDQLQTAVKAAAAITKAPITLFNGTGYIYDLVTFDQCVRDGWCVIAGTQESVINPGENFGHFFAVWGIDGDKFRISDPWNRAQTEVSVVTLHAAMVANWTGPNGQDGFAFKFS